MSAVASASPVGSKAMAEIGISVSAAQHLSAARRDVDQRCLEVGEIGVRGHGAAAERDQPIVLRDAQSL